MYKKYMNTFFYQQRGSGRISILQGATQSKTFVQMGAVHKVRMENKQNFGLMCGWIKFPSK
jgi:hypothetical protein